MPVTINLANLVAFYDDQPEARRHSNAIKTLAGEELGLALLEHYFNCVNHETERVMRPCTRPAGNGHLGARLDGWIKVSPQPNADPVLYQVEVKSWSMHSLGRGNERLPLDAPPEQVSAQKLQNWNENYWDAQQGRFRDAPLRKVLLQMNAPGGEENTTIEPIACNWTAVHPEGEEGPFFTINGNAGDFGSFHVFSMSSYLRGLLAQNIQQLRLNLPDTEQRIQHLALGFGNAK